MFPGWPQCTSQSGSPRVEKNSAWPPRRLLKYFSRPRGPLSAAARRATVFWCVFFFFFWRVSRKGFRERERERSTNRARKTAASPLSCWRERKGPTCACCYRVAQTGARKKKNPPSPGASDERRRRSEEEAFFVADDVEPPTTLAERGVFKGAGALFAVCVGGRATAHGATARRVIMALFISARSRSG